MIDKRGAKHLKKITGNEDYCTNSGRNVGKLTILNEEGTEIFPKHRIMLDLSKEALFDFGKALMELSQNFKEGKHVHLVPSAKYFITESLGLFLINDSNELIICCKEFQEIESYI